MKLYPIDEQPYIISQYGASPTIKALLYGIAAALNPDEDIRLFYEKIFDVDTAEGIGLDIWGRIVGAFRAQYSGLSLQRDPLLGYRGSILYPFNEGLWYDYTFLEAIDGEEDLQSLPDSYYRRLIMYKANINISGSSFSDMNANMEVLYGNRDVMCVPADAEAVLQNGDMYNPKPMRVMFIWRSNNIQPLDKTLFALGVVGALAAGVGWDLQVVGKPPIFGFRKSGFESFDCGNFVPNVNY